MKSIRITPILRHFVDPDTDLVIVTQLTDHKKPYVTIKTMPGFNDGKPLVVGRWATKAEAKRGHHGLCEVETGVKSQILRRLSPKVSIDKHEVLTSDAPNKTSISPRSSSQ